MFDFRANFAGVTRGREALGVGVKRGCPSCVSRAVMAYVTASGFTTHCDVGL